MYDKEKQIVILANSRKKENPEDISVQRTFLEYAIKVIPVLEFVKRTDQGTKLYDSSTTAVTDDLLGGLLYTIDRILASTVFVNIANSWTFLEVDSLLDGLKAMYFYSIASKERQYISLATTKLILHLKTREDDWQVKFAEFDVKNITDSSTLRNAAHQKIKNALYLVPFRYDEDPRESVEDKFIHTSKRAAEKMENIQSGTVPFKGCEDYRFVQAQACEEGCDGKTMHLQVAVNDGHSFLPLFNDMEILQKIFGKNTRVGVFTWEDIVERLYDTIENADGSHSKIEGIVFNPGLMNVRLSVERVQQL